MRLVSWLVLGILCLSMLTVWGGPGKKRHTLEPYQKPLSAADLRKLPGHPRLFGGLRGMEAMRKNAKDGSYGEALAKKLIQNSEEHLTRPPFPREVVGGRLLSTSRKELQMLTNLTTAWVLTGDKRFSVRAIAELQNLAAYEDWHPRHFLDVGEMALGVAFAYDWLWGEMTPEQRKTVATALRKHGMDASLLKVGGYQWLSGKNNWVQVCHAGMIAAALSTAEDDPAFSAKIINRAIAKLPDAMNAAYPPNGAYPEGVMYWGYGTSFNCIALALLEESFGKDFGLSDTPGFSKTLQFVIAGYGNNGKPFSYADCSRHSGPTMNISHVWLAKRFRCGDLITKPMRDSWFKNLSREGGGKDRTIAFCLLYTDALPREAADSKDTWYYSGKSERVNIAMLRTGFEPKDIYLGVKGGKVKTPHGHMDIGSFVLDLDGHRFVTDLGMVTYEDFEGKVKLWNMRQGSDRWKIFRLGPESHNIIRIDGGEQPVEAPGWITGVTKDTVQIDLTPVYRDKAERVGREWKLFPDRMVLTDTLTGLKPGAKVVMQFCIHGNCEISGAEAAMRHKGFRASVTAAPSEGIQGEWSVRSAQSLHNALDPADKGVNMLYYSFIAPASGEARVTFIFAPGKQAHQQQKIGK